MREKHPRFIQTTIGFIFKIQSYADGLLIINQGNYVIHYNIINEAFYGQENNKLVKRDLEPLHPEVFKYWMAKL
ncbi:hypothetical protein LVD17_24125 [Fulvivirga ulvae]|uniref:hypothetical protein n=1 Tax=Fulvivirga ulvae TaxID=2904245 RepID=UPI001F24D054|nr:hypothetical protein [Fulvivirga ulvae]UII31385.1 hypothetical protein LVD17_24125 [Fulvivirga ulvae]